MKLGNLQKQMVAFMVRNKGWGGRTFSIARTEKPRALALERKGIIQIVNKNWECWSVKLDPDAVKFIYENV